MGLLDTDLMNRIQRTLDEKFGEGEKLIYGEPWSARESNMEPGSYPANKANIRRLDSRIGVFCDCTRDAVKGHVFYRKEPGFVNGGEGLEEDILHAVTAWCGSEEFSPKAPSQVITYVSAHDNLTLWDKLVDTLEPEGGYHTESQKLRRVYRLAAAIYMTCQGHLFMLSGEEFGRTKEGVEDSYCSPLSINRLDWERAYENADLVKYYCGLIALRKRLPGLCDKSEQAVKRMLWQEKKKGFVSFRLDNRGEIAENVREILVAYNSTEEDVMLELPAGEWRGQSLLGTAGACQRNIGLREGYFCDRSGTRLRDRAPGKRFSNMIYNLCDSPRRMFAEGLFQTFSEKRERIL